MKTKHSLLFGIILLLLIALGAYFWANGLIDSLFEYRSPLAEDPPVAGDALEDALTSRVVIVLVDALREDTALDPQVMPYLHELRQHSAWATMYSQPPSYSAPGWTTILTGAWTDINDSQPANPPDENSVRTFTQDDIFAAAERSGLRTAVSGYFWFEDMLAGSGVDAGFYTLHEDNAADEDVLEAAILWLGNADYGLILIHLDQVDYAGHHEGGPKDPNWDAAAGRVDTMLRTIVSYLDLEQDTLLIFSDHGQIDQGGHGGHEPITLVEPFVMLGAGVIPGHYADMEMVDIAPTVVALLGTSIPAGNQGRALTEMLTMTDEQKAIFEQSLSTQQENLLQSYTSALGVEVDIAEAGAETSVAARMAAIRTELLGEERLPRLLVSVVLACLPVFSLYKKRDQETRWLLLGAGIYLLVFNFLYLVVAHKTYSLSSLVSASELIVSTAMYVGVSFVVGWLVCMIASKRFSISPILNAQYSLRLTLLTLYLLALPILWNYYRNGVLITWTLPEFAPMFVGFLCILQALFVAAMGLLLVGTAALIALFKKKATRKMLKSD